MAAEQHQDGAEIDQSQTSRALSVQPDTNDAVQNVQDLLYQDKCTVIVKAVDLLVRNVQQQQQIAFLNQTIGEAVEQQELMLKDLHDRPVIESFMTNLEAQNLATRKHIQDKAEAINTHIKSNELLRKQLRKEIGGLRSCTNDIKVRANEIEETGKTLHNALQDTKIRLEGLKKQLDAASGTHTKLRAEVLEKDAEIRKIAVGYEEMVRKIKGELLEKDRQLKLRTKELEMEKQKTAGQGEVCNQILSEKKAIGQRHEQLQQHLDNEVSHLEQQFTARKDELDQAYKDAVKGYENKTKELDRTIGSLTDAKLQDEEYIMQVEAALSQMGQELRAADAKGKELEEQLAKLKQKEPSVPTTVEEMPIAKRTKFFPEKRKIHVFHKNAAAPSMSGGGGFGKTRSARQPQTSNDESQSSFHLDNNESSFSSLQPL
uniref:Uncharacterized protein n=1 Tax=Anopheles dirus TaxID=7168 RepID=A0A182NCH6_9DIPT